MTAKVYTAFVPKFNADKVIGSMGDDKIFIKSIKRSNRLWEHNAYPIEISSIEELTADGCLKYRIEEYDTKDWYSIPWDYFVANYKICRHDGWNPQGFISLNDEHWVKEEANGRRGQ